MTAPFPPPETGSAQDEADTLRPRFNADGLLAAIVQDADTDAVLMFAWMNAEALRQTIDTRRATFWSRSRNELWVKGESSGHTLSVVEIRIDCDQDAILLRAIPAGPACHTHRTSCFYRTVDADGHSLSFLDD